MSDRAAAWRRLESAATDYAAGRTKAQAQELSRAAIAWAAVEAMQPENAPRVASGERSRVAGDGYRFRFGRHEGKAPEETPVDALRWYERVFSEAIDNPDKSRFRDNNRRSLEVVRAELRRRGEAANHG